MISIQIFRIAKTYWPISKYVRFEYERTICNMSLNTDDRRVTVTVTLVKHLLRMLGQFSTELNNVENLPLY